jgi:chemotaxis protein methyltransferase CheR
MPAPMDKSAPVVEIAAIRALADHGEWDEADRRCRGALANDRLNTVVYFYHALVLEQVGRHAEAERALRQAIYLDRRFVLAHYYLGLLLQKQGHFSAAARAFQNVLQLGERADPAQVFAEGDGITAGELVKLTRMHLEALEGA